MTRTIYLVVEALAFLALVRWLWSASVVGAQVALAVAMFAYVMWRFPEWVSDRSEDADA